MALAAASLISSVNAFSLRSSTALNMPGKTRTLFIWLSKSERPVPTMNAPASRASCGSISGTGLAIANIIGLFMLLTMSFESMSAADTPINRSLPFITSARVPLSPFKFVVSAIAAFDEFRSCLSLLIAPFVSQRITFFMPAL